MNTNLNNKKVFIDKEIWYIENFLNEKELNELMIHANEKIKWYKTLRSPCIRNKFIGVEVEIHPEGTICPKRKIDLSGDAIFPNQDAKEIKKDRFIFIKPNGIFDRLEQVLPKQLVRQNTLQSFWPPEQEKDFGGAYKWHYEKGQQKGFNDRGMTATWSIYLNNDFDGGVLEFLNKPYSIKPIPGMLVSIPLSKNWTHRVTPVANGIRHTLYGSCFKNIFDREINTRDNC